MNTEPGFKSLRKKNSFHLGLKASSVREALMAITYLQLQQRADPVCLREVTHQQRAGPFKEIKTNNKTLKNQSGN